MTTYFDLSTDSAQASWRRIRTFRASSSARLASTLGSDRVEVFHMALEQSQQQFAAASVIGYESRPLNLFYGLAQAGRAIAAASSRLGPRAQAPYVTWLPTGHGLKFEPRLSKGGLLTQLVKVLPSDTDSYSRLSHALGSPTDTVDVSVGALFAQTPEISLHFQQADWGAGPILPMSVAAIDVSMGTGSIGWDVHAPLGPSVHNSTLEELEAWRDIYPAFRGMKIGLDSDGRPIKPHSPGHIRLLAEPGVFRSIDGFEYQPLGARLYRGSYVVLPRSGNSSDPLHPLAIWWLQLYALSMLARYSPRDWRNTLSLRRGVVASAVELVLDTAIHAVPNLIAEALESLEEKKESVNA